MSRIVPPKQRRAIWRPLWELPGRFDDPIAGAPVDGPLQGSVLGILWAIVTPVVMIAIFIYFAGIFNARFGTSSSPWDYAILFCGLLPWNMFRNARALLQHDRGPFESGQARRLRETLPIAQALSGWAINCSALGALVATIVIRHELHLTILWLPVVLVADCDAWRGLADCFARSLFA
jgi:lipopolysaccharide transport system permease protein